MKHCSIKVPTPQPAPRGRFGITLCVGIGALLVPMMAAAVLDCTIANEPVNPANGHTTQGKSGLMRCVDRDSGRLQREEEWRNGASVGLRRYYDNGVLSQEFSVNERGNRQGRFREFAPSGQVLRDRTYDNGSVTGLARQFHGNGRLSRVSFHTPSRGELAFAEFTSHGQLGGLHCASEPRLAPDVDDGRLCGFNGASQVELFRENQKPWARMTLDHGRRVHQEQLYDNGAVQQRIQRDGGRRIGQRFSPQGVKLREERFLETDQGSVPETARIYAESGALQEEKRWTDGKLVSEQSYYLNGQMKQQTTHDTAHGQALRRVRQYHDNGRLAADGQYLGVSRYRQLPVGSHQRFDEHGQIRSESIHDDWGRLTRERSWDAAGALVRDDEVFEDGSRKAFAR